LHLTGFQKTIGSLGGRIVVSTGEGGKEDVTEKAEHEEVEGDLEEVRYL